MLLSSGVSLPATYLCIYSVYFGAFFAFLEKYFSASGIIHSSFGLRGSSAPPALNLLGGSIFGGGDSSLIGMVCLGLLLGENFSYLLLGLIISFPALSSSSSSVLRLKWVTVAFCGSFGLAAVSSALGV